MNDHNFRPPGGESGISLIEVLVSMFIVTLGLLGLAGLQARAMNAEVESYARGQALMLASEMADRLSTNLSEAQGNTTANTKYFQRDTTYGSGYSNDCITAANDTSLEQAQCCAAKSTQSARDLCEWDLALKGAGETTASGTTKVGSMTKAVGCVTQLTTDANVYQIVVAWQGRGAGATVASDLSCGSAQITTFRRAVGRIVRVAQLGA